LQVNEIVQGTTIGATSEGEATCGDESASLMADVWYSIEGAGQELFATTCTDNSVINGNMDTQLTVFSGSCGELQCIGSNDDDDSEVCSLKSTVSFFAAEGTRYYILVHGYRGVTGSFALQVRSCENGPCPVPAVACNDGIQNGDEEGIDCGGSNCEPCPPSCDDGVQNGDEAGIDCGGSNCEPCPSSATCDDGIQNGDEEEIDCGGSMCEPCHDGSGVMSVQTIVPRLLLLTCLPLALLL
jgi:hypothetical protein